MEIQRGDRAKGRKVKRRWSRRIKELLLMAAVTLAAATLMGYLRAPSYDTLPTFEGVTIDGKTVRIPGHPKRPYLLHFWATWCPTCRAEAPGIDALSKTHDVVTVAVKSGDDAKLEAFMKDNGYTFAVVNDRDGSLARRYRIDVFPTTLLIDEKGAVVWGETGFTSQWGWKIRLWLAGLMG